ncbi:MAG: SCO1664 family protein [Thermomicrobiales bacterium]
MPDLRIRFEHDDQHETAPPPVDDDAALAILRDAEITATKLVPWGSNYTFAVGLSTADDRACLGIYKPQAGERPLWDFPSGTLYLREYASYLLSDWLGWNLVPPTVVRDGPHGVGSLQLYVEPKDEEIDEATFWGRRILPVEQMVMFDHIANNADRKIGHCLVDIHDRIWGIDHGLTFNADFKLRTVLWQYSGDAISPEVLSDIERLVCGTPDIVLRLEEILSPFEVAALLRRTRALVDSGRYPPLDPHYNVPYGWW